MKAISVLCAAMLCASVSHAAVESGLPDSTGHYQNTQTAATRHDMATADRLLSDEKYAAAIPVLKRVIGNDEVDEIDRSIAYNLRGLSLFMVGRIAEAIDDFTNSLEIQNRTVLSSDHRWKTHFNRGLAYEAANEMAYAADDFIRAYAMAPDERRVKAKIYTFFNKR